MQKFVVVGHSMGGLAARSYMAGMNTTYGGEIARLITYGTPHLGVPTVALLGSSVISAGLAFKMPELDQNSDGIRDLDLLSFFLTQLNAKPLPPADYRSIVSYGPLSENCYPIPFSQSFVFDVLGVSDCVVSAFSQDLANVPIVNPQIRSRLARSIGFQHHVDGETHDYGKIACALGLGCLTITTRSPVDVEVTDPAGFQLSKSLNEIPGAVYDEGDIDGDGELNDIITIPLPLAGNYQIKVIPDNEANPSETYSLETSIDGVTTILAQNQRLQDIPSQGYAVTVLPPNQVPIANAGTNQTVRLGSVVTLNGSGSFDPDKGPGPLTHSWTKTSGPTVILSGGTTAMPTFTPMVAGTYTFSLVVNDGQDSSAPASVTIIVPISGDIDLDGDVDSNDLSRIASALNTKANGPNDLRDLNGDGKIDALDSRILVTRCTRPRCATQ